jgi:hypothetical protein
LNPDGVPAEEIEREKEILRVQVCWYFVSYRYMLL